MPQQRSVSNLQPGTRYVARVRAFNNLSVPSDWSEALEFTTPGDDSVPSEVKNLRVDFTSPSLLISWDPPTLNSDLTPLVDLAYYEITLINGGSNRVHQTTLLSFNYTLEYNRADWGTPVPSFTIEVRACDGSGNKSVPATATATNLVPNDPTDPPELVSAFTIINVSMSADPATQDLAGFRLETSTDGAAWSLLSETIGNTYSHQVEQGSTHFYRYKVRDVFNQYSTNFSPMASTTTISTISQDTTPPAVPVLSVLQPNIALETGLPYIHASWTPGVDTDLNRFDLRIKKTASGLYSYYSVGKDITTFDFTGLGADSTYFVSVRAVDVNGNQSDWSNEQSTQTSHDTTAPAVPSGLATIAGIEAVFVNWNQNTEVDFDHYDVCASQTNGFTPDVNVNKVYSGNANSFVHSATSGQTWYYRVRAVDRFQNTSAFSAQVSGSPQVTNLRDTTPPAQPNSANITLTAGSEIVAAIERSYVDVTWPAGLNAESDLAGWHVLWKRSSDPTYSDVWVPKISNSVRLSGLISNTQYSVHLVAVDTSGNVSAASSPDNAITTPKDSIPPPAPSGISASSGIRSINLQWTPSTLSDFSRFEIYVSNNPSFVPAAGYLYSSPTSGFENITRYSNGSSWADLQSGTTYYMMLRALDVSGNASAYVGPISSTTGYVSDTDIEGNTISGNVIRAGSLSADKITTGTLTATINISAALFRTGTAGARLEFDGSGIRGYATDGVTKNLEYKTADGSLRLVGPIVSGGQVSGATLSIGASPNWLNLDSSGLWMGGSNFGNSPFTVDMTGNVIAKKLTIDSTGMAPTATLINAGNFVLSAAGVVTASSITATGGTIGGTTISPTALTGGVINGATFNIGTGGINFTGSGSITWQPGATGSIIVANSGTIQSSNYVAGTAGWQLGPAGLEINQGTISAQALQIGISNKNLLFNSSFENGTTVATYWTAIGTGHTYSIDSSLFLYQSKSQKILSGGGTCGVSQTLNLGTTPPNFITPFTNTPLSVSIWIVQTTGSTPRAATLTLRTGATVLATTTVTPTFNTWTRLTATAIVPANASYNTITVDLSYAGTVATETFNVEGAQLQRSTFVTDYTPAPLEIPDNYIQAAYISSLNADKLTSGTINAQQINIAGTGYIQSVNYDGATTGYRLQSDKLIFQNGAIQIVAQDGTVSLDNTGLKATYGGQTKLQVDHTGVYIGGNNASNAAVTFDPATGKTVFKSSATGYTFIIDTAATGGGLPNPNTPAGSGKVLRLTDVAGNDTFYLSADGTGYFAKGVVGLGSPNGGAGGAAITAGDTTTAPNRYLNQVKNQSSDSPPGDGAYVYYRMGEAISTQTGWYSRYWNLTAANTSAANSITQALPNAKVNPSQTKNDLTLNWSATFTPNGNTNAGQYWTSSFVGILTPPNTGNYTFYVTSDDGFYLWVNGVIVTSYWGDHTGEVASVTPIHLVAGQPVPINLWHFNNTGGESLILKYSAVNNAGTTVVAKAVIPSSVITSVSSSTSTAMVNSASTGSAMNGTYVGRPQNGTGTLTNDADKARYFDGTSYATMPAGFTFYSGGTFTGFTLEAWVNPNMDFDPGSQAWWGRIIELGNGNSTINGSIIIGRAGRNTDLAIWVMNDSGANQQSTQLGGLLTPQTWSHMVVTLDAAGTLTVYKNGVVVARQFNWIIPNNVTRSTNFIGSGAWVNPASGAQDQMWRGWIDEVAIYQSVLTPQQVAAHYNLSKDQYGYINFDKNGLKLYQTSTPGTGGTLVTHIDPVSASGTFSGTIQSGSMLSGAIYGTSITSSSFRSSSGTKYLDISDEGETIRFHSGSAGESWPASISFLQSSPALPGPWDTLIVYGNEYTGFEDQTPWIELTSPSNGAGGATASGISFGSQTFTIQNDNAHIANQNVHVNIYGYVEANWFTAWQGFSTRSQTNKFSIDWNGAILFYIDVTQVAAIDNAAGTTRIWGPGGATAKTFVIDHPDQEDRWLVHGCLEGPEAAVYYRGEDQCVEGICIVRLPSYFESATRKAGRTVQLTPIWEYGHLPQLYASPIEDGCFVVHSTGASTKFYWRVEAVRSDVEILDPEPRRASVKVNGQGPYRWIG